MLIQKLNHWLEIIVDSIQAKLTVYTWESQSRQKWGSEIEQQGDT